MRCFIALAFLAGLSCAAPTGSLASEIDPRDTTSRDQGHATDYVPSSSSNFPKRKRDTASQGQRHDQGYVPSPSNNFITPQKPNQSQDKNKAPSANGNMPKPKRDTASQEAHHYRGHVPSSTYRGVQQHRRQDADSGDTLPNFQDDENNTDGLRRLDNEQQGGMVGLGVLGVL